MSTGDIRVLSAGPFGQLGAKRCNVALGATTIYPGEPVVRALGGTSVTVGATNLGQVGTDYLVGIATQQSTQTASANGIVYVQPIMPGVIYGIKPKVSTTWDTQAEYDDLVGKRVLIDLTSGAYTILASDNANYGFVVEPLDISKVKNTVAFSVRRGVTELA